MSDDSTLREGLAALSLFFVGDKTQVETLTRVSEMAVDAIPAAEFVGLTMLGANGRPHTGVFTDVASPEIDQAQYRTMSGPCVEAMQTGEIRKVTSTIDDGPWPEFRAACVEHGILSTLSMPLAVADVRYGAMNLYSSFEGAFGPADLEIAGLFAAQASIVIANARAFWEARLLSEQLGESISSRAVIEQAKGIIMSNMHCSADEAFQILVNQSQRENRKLNEVARQVVADTTRR